MSGSSLPFHFECPAAFFEKAEAPAGQRRRIAGIISTETRDRQNEIVLQKGLDFSEFVQHGWFNDNHSKDTDGIVGYPEGVKQFQKGQTLPNGEKAPTNLTWAEGYMLEGHDRADKIWRLGMSLQKSGAGRRLGFSIEGNVERRQGPERKTIAKARVRNTAITNCPVNTDTRLEVLAKSLVAVQLAEPSALEKALTMGTPAAPGSPPVGPLTGAGAGQVLAPESLEMDGQLRVLIEPAEDETKDKKKLSKAEAFVLLHERYPDADAQVLGRIVDLTLKLKEKGLL